MCSVVLFWCSMAFGGVRWRSWMFGGKKTHPFCIEKYDLVPQGNQTTQHADNSNQNRGGFRRAHTARPP
jgi:hypothetical protein